MSSLSRRVGDQRRGLARAAARTSTSSCPVMMCSWVSASTPGTTRTRQRWRRPAGTMRSSLLGVGAVDDDRADAGVDRRAQLGLRTSRCRAGRSSPGRSPPSARGAARRREAHVDAQPLLGEDPQRGRAGERLGGEDDLAGPGGRPRARLERPRAVAQVVLGDDVGGRAELARELDGVAAADGQRARPRRTSAAGTRWRPSSCGGGSCHVRAASPPRTGPPSGASTATSPTRCGCPKRAPWGGMVVIHGAESCKENHHDMARAARAAGLAAVGFDLRGHGETGGRARRPRVLDDVAAIADAAARAPLALRGSSLGGFLAIAAAERARRGRRRRRLPGLGRPGAACARAARFPSTSAARRSSPSTTSASSSSSPRSRCCSCTPRATSASPYEHSRRAARALRRADQAADRRPRRPPPLDPARRRAPGRVDQVRTAGTGRPARP